MARPREFETDDALERAMQVFWKHGYKDASLPDLLDGMKLTRGSLYKAFKDKKNLFLLVLDRYEAAHVDSAVAGLTDRSLGDGRTRILALFGGLVAAAASQDHRGCLLCTAASGAAGDDAEIAQLVHQGLAKMQHAFAFAIGNIEGIPAQDHQTLANTLLTQYIGLRMLARSRLPLGILEQAAHGVEKLLDGAT
jgi:TetR/AcrR family transcriptional repressor of nem operon